MPDPRDQGAAYQQLGGAEDVQGEGLDAGVMHAQLPVDAGALDARQDAQVGGEPRGVCRAQRGGGLSVTPRPPATSIPLRPTARIPNLPGAPQSQHCLLPAMFFTSLITSLVSSCTPPSAAPPAEAAPPLGSPLKALLRASSLLFCSTETHLGRGSRAGRPRGDAPAPRGARGAATGGFEPRGVWRARVGWGRPRHLHHALLLVLGLEVVRPVVCRDGGTGEHLGTQKIAERGRDGAFRINLQRGAGRGWSYC